jgi:hypothetical protein
MGMQSGWRMPIGIGGGFDSESLAPTNRNHSGGIHRNTHTVPAATLDVFDAHRRAAQDAQIAHQRMVGNRKALEAQLGAQGYAKALAQQQAQAASSW